MKEYEVHHVERGGFPGSCLTSFEAANDKAAKIYVENECLFNRSANTGHCGIRIFRMPDRKVIFKKFYHA